MPVEINDITVEATAPEPAPAADVAVPAAVDEPRIADAAERHWRRVAGLQERVRAN